MHRKEDQPDTADHELPGTLSKRWRAIGLLGCWALSFLLGVIGFEQLGAHGDQHHGLLNSMYHAAQLCILHTPYFNAPVPPVLELGRWLAATTVTTAGFTLAWRLLAKERTALQLKRLCGHTVICGLGRKGSTLMGHLLAEKRSGRIVVLDKNPPRDKVKTWEDRGVLVFTGDATDPENLRKVHADCASSIHALLPDDGANCEVAAQACRIRQHATRKPAQPLHCHVRLGDFGLRESLQQAFGRQAPDSAMKLEFLDEFDPEARRLIAHDLPLDGPGLPAGDARQALLVIIGFGRMGRTLAIRAAQLGHFANGTSIHIKVIDRNARQLADALYFRYPHIGKVCSIAFLQQDAESPATLDAVRTWCGGATITNIAVCMDDENRALEIGLRLLAATKACGARIAVRMSRKSGFASLLGTAAGKESSLSRVVPFGMEPEGDEEDRAFRDVDKFARRLHDTYRSLRRKDAESGENQSDLEGRPEMKPWDELPEDFRESNRQQAAHMFIKVRALGCEDAGAGDSRCAVECFSDEQVEFLAEWEHRRWMAERTLAGWTYAPGPKDPILRTSPYLVPWNDLDDAIKEYDRVGVRRIPALLGGCMIKVCRCTPSGQP